MPQKRTIDVQFPRGGLNKRFAIQQSPPFTTLDAENARPEGVFEKRMRGGSRPGLVKSFSTRDSDNPVRLLTVMRSLNAEGRLTYEEDFSATLETDWDAGAWHDDGLIEAAGGVGFGYVGQERGAILKNGAGEPGEKLSTDAPYSVQCRVEPAVLASTLTGTNFGYIRLFSHLDDAAPSLSSNVHALLRCEVRTIPVWYRYRLLLIVDGVIRAGPAFILDVLEDTPRGWGTLGLTIDGNLLRASWVPDPGTPWNAAEVFTDVATASSGKRVGIGVDLAALTDGVVMLDDFRLRYFTTDGGVPPEAVVQATNGVLRRENIAGTLATVIQTGITVASDRTLLAVDRLGKLYIADHGNRMGTTGDDLDVELRLTDGVVSGTSFDSASVTDWTKYDIETDGDWLEILAGSGPTLGLYKISGVASGNLTLASAPGDGSSLTFRVTRGPKVYDSATDAMTRWEPTTGDIPLGCSIIEIFRDRALFGGDPEHSGIYYMSRSGNFDDFNYGASVTDRARAIADLTTSSDGGQLSIPFSAIAAITEDYCLFSAESELYLLRGDPTLGGIMGNVSSQIGIGSRTARCRIPDGSVVFLSRDGLYRFHPSQPFPVSLSRDKLPLDLIDVAQNTSLTVVLEYDVRFQGVHIYVTPLVAGFTKHYWFDWATQGFWLVPLAETDHEPFAITYDAKANHVLLGCRDGYIRHYDAAASTDDGTTINSYVLYGPFNLGGNAREGAISDLYVVLDDASGDAVVQVFVGDDAESAYKAAVFTSRTVSAGYSGRLPIRARGAVAFVKVSDSSGSQWAIDSLTLVTQRNGRHR